MSFDDLIESERQYQHTRIATVARLAVWLYGWTAVMMAAGYAVGQALR